ncbi:hypothetical protein FALCPG4_011449 [Fusarium falciforme]
MSSNRLNTASTGSSSSTYNETPPSNAEMATELQQLRTLVAQLRAQVQARTTPSTTTSSPHDKDPGDVVKPPMPEPSTRQASDVIHFLTRMKGYFRMFPRRIDTPTKMVLFTTPLLHGTAKAWFEPIWRDFLKNDEGEQVKVTASIFAS